MTHYAEGIYNVEITGQGLNVSSKKGTPGFFLKIIPEGGAYERSIQWWITDKTADNVVRDLRKIGFEGTSWSHLDPEYEQFYDFRGQTIEAVCKHEENDGKTYERWELPFEGKGIEIVKLDRKGARKLDALFGKQLKSVVPGGPLKPQEPVVPPPEASVPLTAENTASEAAKAESEDDGIPF